MFSGIINYSQELDSGPHLHMFTFLFKADWQAEVKSDS